jgi:CheY-like chemotaxis protein
MKILYVEDNEDNVYVLKNRLTRAGHRVLIAPDGAQGVTMAAAEQPNLILMDLSLPVVRAENLNPGVSVMQPANQGMRHPASDPLNRARDRCIMAQVDAIREAA